MNREKQYEWKNLKCYLKNEKSEIERKGDSNGLSEVEIPNTKMKLV